VQDTAQAAREKAGEAGESIRETAQEQADKAKDTAGWLGRKINEALHGDQEAAKQQ
jgi:hypothetical protein